jgi:hypothetical protein
MPGRGKGPGRQSVRELWEGMVGFSLFGGLLLGLTLIGLWSGRAAPFWPLLVGGCTVLWATVPNVISVRELVRRGAWVPPGTARHPTVMAVAWSALLLAVGVAVVGVIVGLAQVIDLDGVPPAVVGVTVAAMGFAALGLARLVVPAARGSGRVPPGAAGGTLGPGPAADPPRGSPI